ncbi:hypothetical protein ES288_A11G331500v1 [Gossypium darwinii]|uniref:Uncharacterized protein n=1 Tax=Gossypium darwinii TaxID=34276 RepID=A0A5D2ET84_GOSDA|nr:hypothetical protein ES288_A11G331500v1 [Gossypium darwinii]
MGHGSKVILFSHLDEQPEVQGLAVLVSTKRVSTISPIGISLCVISQEAEGKEYRCLSNFRGLPPNDQSCCINPWNSARKQFLGFDANELTSRSRGKATAAQQIRKVKGYKALDMIGDGATDLKLKMVLHQ